MEHPYQVRPVEVWPRAMTEKRTHSQFRADIGSTLALLEAELSAIDARDVFLQVACRPSDIRVDGKLKQNARQPEHPGIILTFTTRSGQPANFPCDTYLDWRDNLRGIALSLKALRAVDRYGVTTGDEQYIGFGKLPGAGQSSAQMSLSEAAGVLVNIAEEQASVDLVLTDREVYTRVYRKAAKRTHPATGGSERDWASVSEAKATLDRHFA